MNYHYFSPNQPPTHKYYTIKVNLRGYEIILISSSGVFSARYIDKGTRLLIENMIIEDKWYILDLGTGYGVIGIVAAKLAPNGFVVMTDINKQAIRLAKLNLQINNVSNAKVLWGNLYEPVNNKKFDTILTNPPISAGMEVCKQIIKQAPEHLKRNGLLQIVARHHKGGRRLMNLMEEVFGNVEIIASKGGYRVYISRLK